MAWTNFFSCICLLLILSIASESAHLHADRCGHVSYEQPAILGRNVTFTFTPSLYNENATLEWQRTNKINAWSTLPRKNKFTQFVENGAFFLVVTDTVHTDSGSDAVFYRVQYLNDSVNCTMEASKLELKDISEMDCGYVFLKTNKIEQGKKVEIEFYPTQDSYDERTWVRTNNNQTVTLNIAEEGGYVENAMTNNKYVLTIFSFNSDKDGDYAVRCNTNLHSDGVKVILPVAPDSLTLEGRTDIDTCTSCIVGSVGEEFSVFCKINGGTEPTSVSMLIGNESPSNVLPFDRSDLYVVFFKLLNEHHGKLMKCLVKHDALESPMSVEALIYVIKQPSFQGMEMPSILKEGDLVDITCTFSPGRPSPTLSLKYDNIEISPVEQINTFSTVDQYYSSVLSLTTFNRSWNGVNISCCGYSEWYWNETLCFSPKRVEYRFPPSSLGLELRKGNKAGELNAVCTVYDSNPLCKVKWRAPAGSIHSERSSQNVSKPYGAWNAEFMATVNKTENNDKESIICESDCQDFNVTSKRSIFLPYSPVIEFNISGVVLEITKGSLVYVSCITKSSPSSNISWIEDATGEKGEKELKLCKQNNVCVLDIQGHNITQRIFSCHAENLVGNGTKTLTVYITESRVLPDIGEQEKAENSGFLTWILLGAAVAVVAVIAVVVFLIWKRKTADKEKSASNNYCEEAIRHNDGEEMLPQGNLHDIQGETSQPDAVYSEINKATKKSISDDDTMYSVVNKSGKPESAKDTPQAKKNAEDGQLLYVDLAFDSPGSQPTQEVVVKRRESAVEYVGIDFSKTAEAETSQNQSNEMENIYANQ